jgi:hypothetical protein
MASWDRKRIRGLLRVTGGASEESPEGHLKLGTLVSQQAPENDRTDEMIST